MSLAEALARKRVALGFLVAVAAIVLAQPTWFTWRVGLMVALAGEALRVWASGHLEKSREVTRSGPYKWMRHPLYAGSALMAIGIVVAAHSVIVTVLTTIYMAATMTAAIRTEEAFLTQAFGETYPQYRESRGAPMDRRFSVARAIRNREYRAVMGLLTGFGILALKIARYL